MSQFCESDGPSTDANSEDVDKITKAVEKVAIDPNDPRAAKKAAKRERKAEAERRKAAKAGNYFFWVQVFFSDFNFL